MTWKRSVAILLRILAVAAAFALLYLALINAFLSTSLFGRVVNAEPDVVDIHYERAWSLLPGRVHARNLSIRGRDPGEEWIVRLDEVEFDIRFVAPAKRLVEFQHVRGGGFRFAPPSSRWPACVSGRSRGPSADRRSPALHPSTAGDAISRQVVGRALRPLERKARGRGRRRNPRGVDRPRW
jgi:hypothetical protein